VDIMDTGKAVSAGSPPDRRDVYLEASARSGRIFVQPVAK